MDDSRARQALAGDKVNRIRLKDLLLDDTNPRFGLHDRGASQEQILDLIVEKFGVNDVLSSIAVNGYFDAEPVVCRRMPDSRKAVVVEGNRRLAACLIITGDKRASNQARRSANFSKLWNDHGRRPLDPVPAITFAAGEEEQEQAILSYRGVRHFASAQPWDSYAKAAWFARVVHDDSLDVRDVSKMLGDRHRIVDRMLEGYYLVQQLAKTGHFNQRDSIRSGRGSVTDYPFSWVYMVLGYKTVRDFLELGDGNARPDPLDDDNLDKGSLLLQSMFGDKSRGRNAAIDDSWQLGDLAAIFANRDKVRLLEQGKDLAEIEELTEPITERLPGGLGDVLDTLRDLVARLPEQSIPQETATDLLSDSGRVRKLAADLDRKLQEIARGGDDEEAE